MNALALSTVIAKLLKFIKKKKKKKNSENKIFFLNKKSHDSSTQGYSLLVFIVEIF